MCRVRICRVPGCDSNDKEHPDVHFHKLPPESKKNNYRDEWIRRIRRVGTLPKTLFICSRHFSSDCYQRDLKSELLGLPLHHNLKPDAIPTIFPFGCGIKRGQTSENRAQTKISKLYIDEVCSIGESSNRVDTANERYPISDDDDEIPKSVVSVGTQTDTPILYAHESSNTQLQFWDTNDTVATPLDQPVYQTIIMMTAIVLTLIAAIVPTLIQNLSYIGHS